MIAQQVKNKKSGKTGTVVEIKEEKLLVQYSKSKIWGLTQNFDFIESEVPESEQIPESKEPEISESEPVCETREPKDNSHEDNSHAHLHEEEVEFSDPEQLRKLFEMTGKIADLFNEANLSVSEAYFVLDMTKFFTSALSKTSIENFDIEKILTQAGYDMKRQFAQAS